LADTEDLNRDELWKQFLARPCTLPNFEATITGFPTEEEAREVWGRVESHLNIFGRMWNLERLHKVTLAADYHAALAEIDRGTGTGNVVMATRDEFGEGVAMAVSVLVDGTPRTHLVINAGLMALLRTPDTPESHLAVSILAHECCHIHDLALHDTAYPGVLLQQRLSGPRIYFNQMATACWSEYAACRLSAEFAGDEETELYEETFCSCLAILRERGNNAIRKCREDANYGELLGTLVTLYGSAMKYGAYLLGHLAGLGKQLAEAAPRAAELVASNKYFDGAFSELKTTLEEMWGSYGQWSAEFDVFEPLEALAEKVLRIGGITLEPMPEGIYVGVPFNPEVDAPWII
jgi:hypothetical protein